MKTGFFRVMWGRNSNDIYGEIATRLVSTDTKLALHNKYEKDIAATVLVYGSENLKALEGMGFKCILLDDKPLFWEGRYMWKHKLEAMRVCMQSYDAVVVLDFDCVPIRPLPPDFWERSALKMPLQASLISYKRRSVGWRTEDLRKMPCGCFVYIREKHIPDELIRINDSFDFPVTDELVMAKWTDDRGGGWHGPEFYFRNFEPDYFTVENKPGFAHYPHLVKKEPLCFRHYMSNGSLGRVISAMEAGRGPEWSL